MAKPAWREQVDGGLATFRGVSFVIAKSEASGGRKTVAHEYPLRDVGFVEDLGRRMRAFPVTAYVVGSDYLVKRNALLAALEETGPGSLVHPYHGNRRVAVSTWRLEESSEEGGVARFSIEFLETEAAAFSPSVVSSPGAMTGASADHCLAVCNNRWLERYKLTIPSGKTAPAFTLDSIGTLVTDYTTSLQKALSPVVKGTQELAALKAKTDAIVKGVSSLVRSPATLALRFTDVWKSLLLWPTTPRLGLNALLAAYRFTTAAPRPSGALTPSRTVEQANYDAVVSFTKVATIVQAARFATDAALVSRQTPTGTLDSADVDTPSELLGFDSYDDAIAARDTLVDAIDTEADAAADDEVYSALLQLRADLIAAVPGERNHLARLIQFAPPVTLPSLVIAYQLYGDVALADDVVARNRVRHPGFVVGGRSLQVIASA